MSLTCHCIFGPGLIQNWWGSHLWGHRDRDRDRPAAIAKINGIESIRLTCRAMNLTQEWVIHWHRALVCWQTDPACCPHLHYPSITSTLRPVETFTTINQPDEQRKLFTRVKLHICTLLLGQVGLVLVSIRVFCDDKLVTWDEMCVASYCNKDYPDNPSCAHTNSKALSTNTAS